MKALAKAIIIFFTIHQLGASAAAESDKAQPANENKPPLRFMAYDGDPKKPAGMTFQVNGGGHANFLNLGEAVPNTKFKLTSFDPNGLTLTVADTATNTTLVLKMAKVVNSK